MDPFIFFLSWNRTYQHVRSYSSVTTIIGKLCIMFAFRAHLSVMLGHQVTFYAMIYFGE